MVESDWPELGGKELRYDDHTWRLTGSVDVRDRGELLAVDVENVDEVRHPAATLYFGVATAPDSLNPGDLGEHFDRLERGDDGVHLVVKAPGRTYRYELQRIEYD